MLFKRIRIFLVAIAVIALASCGKKTVPALLGEWEGKAGTKSYYLTVVKDGKLLLGSHAIG
jgi:hypothetical protein